MLESRTVTLRKNAPMAPGNGFARDCPECGSWMNSRFDPTVAVGSGDSF
jgi:hypothetical protein